MACSRPLPLALFLILLSLSFRPSCPRTVVPVDGVAQSEAPVLRVGDSIVFREVVGYDLYMFHSKRAFDLCIFAQASLLHSTGSGKPTSYFTWRPSGPGNYYFSHKSRSVGACDGRTRLHVTVVPASELASPTMSPLPAPPPTPGNDDGGDFFPSLPHARRSTSPGPLPSLPIPGTGRAPSAAAPPAFPGSGGGFPFISSNPALPLPTGEAGTATSRPLPATGGGHPAAGTGLGIQMAAVLALVVAALV